MTPRTPQGEVFGALMSSSKHSGVPKDSNYRLFQVLGFTPHLAKVGVRHELPCVGGPTIHFTLGKVWKRECVGGFAVMCVMRVLDEYEPKEATKLVTSAKCIRRVLEEFTDVMLEELPENLPPRKRVDHAIKVTGSRASRQGPI